MIRHRLEAVLHCESLNQRRRRLCVVRDEFGDFGLLQPAHRRETDTRAQCLYSSFGRVSSFGPVPKHLRDRLKRARVMGPMLGALSLN